MRQTLMHLAWGLATAALAIATPLRAIGSPDTPPMTAAAATAMTATATPAAALPANAGAAVNTPPVASPTTGEYGGGWSQVYCAACVGLGAYALFAGGFTMLPVILANPAAYGTFSGTCVLACRSVLDDLMK
ncbi:MAG: hypothetical protein INH02_00280 [Gemmatimonas sp.]|uniref:hypothetical protein n=1 Tax=Gemmatimonas sp. TaxID=1962908 RepID=UPI0025BC567F|nr:hypothetical protein [Gemmatimonas sp.]MCA2985834.1 hypothetical protein [Gemmatimonas sp.]